MVHCSAGVLFQVAGSIWDRVALTSNDKRSRWSFIASREDPGEELLAVRRLQVPSFDLYQEGSANKIERSRREEAQMARQLFVSWWQRAHKGGRPDILLNQQ